jgi:integrase
MRGAILVGRPPLPVGTFGKIMFLDQRSGSVQARVKFRDFDGRVRLVSKVGPSRSAAVRALKTELADRASPGPAAGVSPATRVRDLAKAWLAAPNNWSTGTDRTYRSMVKTQINPALGDLRLREVTPGVIGRLLADIAGRSGHGAARTSRSALSGMFLLAVRDGAIAANPVRDSGNRLRSTPTKTPRALAPDETGELVALFRTRDRALALDLPDLVDWMLGTGARIGEALATRIAKNRDGRPLLDLDAGTWEVDATVVRIPGKGLVIQSRTKTEAGWRVLAIPAFATDLMRARSVSAGEIFTAPFASGLRDPNNVSGDLRQLLDAFGCKQCNETGYQVGASGEFVLGPRGRRLRCDQGPWSWVTSHTFRKTVATRLDEAGFTPRQVADQLGHANPSMTLDVYFGRHVVSAATAQVLDRR